MAPPIQVELLPPTAHADLALMERVSELTKKAYAGAEAGLWTDGATRTSLGTIDELYPELAPLLATPCDFVIYQGADPRGTVIFDASMSLDG